MENFGIVDQRRRAVCPWDPSSGERLKVGIVTGQTKSTLSHQYRAQALQH